MGMACLGLAFLMSSRIEAGEDSRSMISVRRAIPTGSPETSILEIEQILPREVQQGQAFDYRLRIRNLTQCPVNHVVITQRPPDRVRVVASFPQATLRDDGTLVWQLGTIGVEGMTTIHARAIAEDLGALTLCAEATYRVPVCGTIQSTRPALALALDVPIELTRCEEIPVRLTVTNSGTGTCTGVMLRYFLPEGVVSADGRRQFAYSIPTLPAGASKQVALRVRAVRTGRFTHQASASSAEGLKAEAAETTLVTEPKLQVLQTGSAEQFAGRNITYTFTVRNVGDSRATNVVVDDVIPSGINLVSVQPANATRLENRLTWSLPELAPGASRTFSLTMRSRVRGRFTNHVTARAECADAVQARYASVVKGIPAILLEVVDRDDPVEVGGTETYIITTTNQGSAEDTNLVIQCELEDNMAYSSSDGPTKATVNGRIITFAPLAELPPKGRAEWRVVCHAKTAGDVRFKVALTSDQLTRPVEETEATHLY